jgi:ATP-dependent DNA ligase
MPYEDQGHTRATARRRFQNRPAKNAYGIVRHSTLWLKPVLVGQFEFVEWTDVHHLRHTKFVALRDDKKPKDVRRES